MPLLVAKWSYLGNINENFIYQINSFFLFLFSTRHHLWHVTHVHEGMLTRTACQFCVASRIPKPNTIIDISHSCPLSMFPDDGKKKKKKNMDLRTQLIHWHNPAVTHSLCACLSIGDVIKMIPPLPSYIGLGTTLNSAPIQERAALGSKGIWIEIKRPRL